VLTLSMVFSTITTQSPFLNQNSGSRRYPIAELSVCVPELEVDVYVALVSILQGDNRRKDLKFLVGKKLFYITKHRRWPMKCSHA
jgi:hypothetical protein